jgi:hypothetical protein
MLNLHPTSKCFLDKYPVNSIGKTWHTWINSLGTKDRSLGSEEMFSKISIDVFILFQRNSCIIDNIYKHKTHYTGITVHRGSVSLVQGPVCLPLKSQYLEVESWWEEIRFI